MQEIAPSTKGRNEDNPVRLGRTAYGDHFHQGIVCGAF
jgi:hypothetical protein